MKTEHIILLVIALMLFSNTANQFTPGGILGGIFDAFQDLISGITGNNKTPDENKNLFVWEPNTIGNI